MAGQITTAKPAAALAGLDRLPTALRLPELLANTFGHLSARDGWQAAATCKAWRGPWRQRLKGMLRCVRRGLPVTRYNEHVSAADGGVIITDYDNCTVNLYSLTGNLLSVYQNGDVEVDPGDYNVDEPSCAVCSPSDGDLMWVIDNDRCELTLIRNTDSRRLRTIDFWYYDAVDLNALPFDETQQPKDLAVAGDALLVLCNDYVGPYGRVIVLDVDTGAFRYYFGGEKGTAEELREPQSLAVAGDLVYVADTYNHQVKVFRLADGTGTLVRTFGRAGTPPELDEIMPYWHDTSNYYDARIGAGPGEFNEPWGIAVGKRRLYVSESAGARIQVLSLPDGEPMHIVRSPDGLDLTGMYFATFSDGTGARVWCCGSEKGYTGIDRRQENRAHIFAICD